MKNENEKRKDQKDYPLYIGEERRGELTATTIYDYILL